MSQIPLRDLAKRKNPRLKKIRLGPIEPTKSIERDLHSIYLRPVRRWQQNKGRIVQEYSQQLARVTDGMIRDNEWLRGIIQEIVGDIAVELTFWDVLIADWASNVVQWHMRRIVGNLKYASNVDLSDYLSEGDVADTVEAIVARNSALIRDVSDQTKARISDIVYRGLTGQTPEREVAKQITAATGLARKRASRIAQDQSNKLSAALDRQRMKQLGFDGIIWRHSGKRDYRPEHKARNGAFFKWSSTVMKTDPPGFQPFCGCNAVGEMDLTNG